MKVWHPYLAGYIKFVYNILKIIINKKDPCRAPRIAGFQEDFLSFSQCIWCQIKLLKKVRSIDQEYSLTRAVAIPVRFSQT